MLRYWEQEFPELKPVRRRGRRRYYTRQEVELVSRIIDLLYNQEFTISGARKQLKNPVESNSEESENIKVGIDEAIGKLNEALEILATD